MIEGVPIDSLLLNFLVPYLLRQTVAVELLAKSLVGRLFNIRPIPVGLFSLNVLTVIYFP